MTSYLFDLLAFLGWLFLAWFFDWQTSELVWSLWLSSFVLGLGFILTGLLGNEQRALQRQNKQLSYGRMLLRCFPLFIFFLVHFSIFHFAQSLALNLFFPIASISLPVNGSIAWADLEPLLVGYIAIAKECWPFILLATISDRGRFRSIFHKKFSLLTPYANVLRMHGLIFFFILAHWWILDSFPVYMVVYAIYFFPWHALRHWQQTHKSEV